MKKKVAEHTSQWEGRKSGERGSCVVVWREWSGVEGGEGGEWWRGKGREFAACNPFLNCDHGRTKPTELSLSGSVRLFVCLAVRVCVCVCVCA